MPPHPHAKRTFCMSTCKKVSPNMQTLFPDAHRNKLRRGESILEDSPLPHCSHSRTRTAGTLFPSQPPALVCPCAPPLPPVSALSLLPHAPSPSLPASPSSSSSSSRASFSSSFSSSPSVSESQPLLDKTRRLGAKSKYTTTKSFKS